MKTLKVPLKEAQKIKMFLQEKDLLDKRYPHLKEDGFLYFPILRKVDLPYSVVEKKIQKKQKKTLREALVNILSKEESDHLKTSFDTVGKIAILDIDEFLISKEKEIAQTLLCLDPKIKTVLKKAGIHEGEFRTQKLIYLAGEKTKETIHRENGVQIKLNVETVYFSARSSTERKRIYEQVKKGEHILVMFSGCGVFPLVLAKNTKAADITSVEINPDAHAYAVENEKMNKIENVTFYEGDVCKVVPSLKQFFDRILMPLPKSAEDFLDVALSTAKKGTIIHFYDFQELADMPQASLQKIRDACEKKKISYTVLSWNKCGQFSPGKYRVCVDFQI